MIEISFTVTATEKGGPGWPSEKPALSTLQVDQPWLASFIPGNSELSVDQTFPA